MLWLFIFFCLPSLCEIIILIIRFPFHLLLRDSDTKLVLLPRWIIFAAGGRDSSWKMVAIRLFAA